jgi:hypothetical protein
MTGFGEHGLDLQLAVLLSWRRFVSIGAVVLVFADY